ncbi:MAG: phosphate ABC transporter substrate-binding protein PstS [Kovacikia sp.]
MVSSLKATRQAVSISAVALALGLASCAPSTTNAPSAVNSPGASPVASSAAGGTISINGAGATAPEPLYQRWFAEYKNQNPNVQISYQGVGSGAGIKQFNAGTVDFGATDAPLKEDERKAYPAARGKLIQIPSTGLFVVFAYNLDGVDDLKLSRESFCGIADGSIKTWNDAKIAKDNPGAKLSNDPVVFVYRSDGSGTTSIFTHHLEKACPNWKAGAGKTIAWPTGTGAKGNPGVTAQIQQTKGSIGYTEYSFAKENGLKMATLQNKAGEFITPSPDAAAKALEGVTVGEDLSVKVPDPAAKGAYPIVSLTYLLLYGQYDQPQKAETLKKVVTWALKDGKQFTTDLGYIPLPDTLISKVSSAIDTIKVASK